MMSFGPNATVDGRENYHHRSAAFRSVLADVRELFTEKFDASAYDVLLISGSGTCALQAVAASLDVSCSIADSVAGKFKSRLWSLLSHYHRLKAGSIHQALVRYETSVAQVNRLPNNARGIVIADMVSSFPYYDSVSCGGVDVMVTVNSTQLGGMPVLGIVCVKKNAWNFFCGPDGYDYLNLSNYREAMCSKGETPFTPSMVLVKDLQQRLQSLDVEAFKKSVDERADVLRGLGLTLQPPVLSIPAGSLLAQDEVESLGIYRAGRAGRMDQIFLWSGTDEQFTALLRVLRRKIDVFGAPSTVEEV